MKKSGSGARRIEYARTPINGDSELKNCQIFAHAITTMVVAPASETEGKIGGKVDLSSTKIILGSY